MSLHRRVLTVFAATSLATFAAAFPGQLDVIGVVPSANSSAPPSTEIRVSFDRALDTSSVDSDSFRVFGRGSGTASGTLSFADGGATLVFQPDAPFTAGEVVWVNLSNAIVAADASPLRAAGYAFQFSIATQPSSRHFERIDHFSNRSASGTTRIYGAAAVDLDGDGALDLATVNEVSGDVRVFMNHDDGSGLYGDFLPPTPIGFEASPNEPADFDNDGNVDLCVSATASSDVMVLLGAGDGSFASVQSIDTGAAPHGIAALDIDGDGDLDIANTNLGTDEMTVLENDGNGVFTLVSSFDTGYSGEYGLTSGDLDGDGITDLLVGARSSERLVTLLGNGDGTFTIQPGAQNSGGGTWVVVLADVDGDGVLDASTANSYSFNGAVLIGDGDGSFGPPVLFDLGAHTVSTDLGDLDGDGDIDLVLSSFGGGFWRVFTNDGDGDFSFDQQFDAPDNPSCAILLDADDDGDLDMALTDEIADVVILMENEDEQAPFCFGDGAGASCPCNNEGTPGHGCENGTFEQGAVLTGAGRASLAADSLRLVCQRATPSQPGLFFQGNTALGGGDGFAFGDGLRCVGTGIVRLQIVSANAAGSSSTTIPIGVTGGMSAGQTKHYQLWFRDPTLSVCGTGFNLSNALSVTWAP